MDDERFDDTLRAFLDAEADQAASAAPPVGEALGRLREVAGPPLRRALLPVWLVIVIGLLAALLVGTAIAVGSGLLRLSREVEPTPSPQTVISRFDPSNGGLQSGGTYGFTLTGSSVIVAFTAPLDARWTRDGTGSSFDDTFVSGSKGGHSAGRVGFALPDDVYADPCHRRAGVAGVGPGVDDLIAGLQASLGGITGITLDAPRDATIGGMDARELTITFGTAFDASGCDLRSILLWHEATDLEGIPYSHAGTLNYPLSDGVRLQSGNALSVDLIVLDVQGTRVLVEVDAPDSANLPGNLADLVDSIRFMFTEAASEPSSSFPVLTPPSPVPTSAFWGPTPLPGGFLVPQVPTSMWIDPQHQVGLELTVPEPLEWWADPTPNELLVGWDPFGPSLEVAVPPYVQADACRWQSGGILPSGRTVDGLTRALRQSLGKIPRATVSEPVDTTLGTLPARKFTFTAPSDGTYGCDLHSIRPLAFLSTDERLPGGGAQFTDELFVVEVHGRLVVVAAEFSDAESARLHQILDSIHWK